MFVTLALVTAALNLAAAVADFARARFVLANSAELNIDQRWLQPLGWLKAAGGAGLVLGVFGVPLVGTAAAAGLCLFFTGAVGIHVYAKVFHNIVYPGALLALAAATLALDLTR